MARLDPLRRIANRAAQTFGGAAPFPGVGLAQGGVVSATGNVPRIARDVERAIARDPREAMTSRIATAPGPIPQRLRTASASNLDPTKIQRVFDAADLGVALYEYADLCKAMREKDTHLMGVDRHRRQAVANKPFVVSPADDADPVAVALAHLGRGIVRGVGNFSQAVYAALSKNCDGWSLNEILWAPGTIRFRMPDGTGGHTPIAVDGLWPSAIEWIHPKHTEFNTAGANSDEPLLNVGSTGAIRLTPGKFFYTLAPGEGIASARGYSRAVVWMHFFKHASWRDWVVFLHLYGIPFLQGKIDRSKYKDDAMLDVLEHALEVYGTGEERPILPDGLEIEVNDPVSISGSGEAHKAMIGMCNAEISKAVEGVTLTTEAGGPGSYALGYVHADAAHEVIVGDAVTTSADITAQVIRAAIVHNADGIARAFALAGLSCKPWDLAPRTPPGMFRTDREWTPEVRQRLFSGALKDGVPISMAMYRHELQLDAPHDKADHVPGEAVTVAAGGAAVGAVDASAGVKVEKPEDAASNPDKQPSAPTTDNVPTSESETVAHPGESLNGAQVTALLDVIAKVGTGELSKEVAKQVIATAFPITPERIAKLIDPVEVKPPPAPAQNEG